ncbi:gastrin/cholecystokinin-like peptide [Pelodytes ibericus]
MDRKVCVSVLLAMLVTASICRPMKDIESAKHGLDRKSPSSGLNRRDLLESLSHEQKQLMSQLLAELSAAEGHLPPMHDRDYAGWMDFGRRSLEDAISDS